MDPTLIGNFIRFPTAKAVWDAIATTYFDGSDTSQVYELRRRVARLKQAGGSLEKFYTDLQGLWHEIDFRRPNLMECPLDIHHYNALLQEDRVYTFLDGIDDRLDKHPERCAPDATLPLHRASLRPCPSRGPPVGSHERRQSRQHLQCRPCHQGAEVESSPFICWCGLQPSPEKTKCDP
jgi:hypothetical protein